MCVTCELRTRPGFSSPCYYCCFRGIAYRVELRHREGLQFTVVIMIEKAVLFACFVGMTCGFAMDLSGRITKPTCVDIPSDLALCQNIGYNQMRMPNLLDHDSIFEVKDQSQGWIPLLIVNCDNDTQLFLCSLFSPVCLDRPIYPCRSLCRKVRQNCEPIMLKNCFPWPSMLECDLFPEDNGLCIQSEMRQKNTTDQPTMSSSLPTGE